ncbi:hypothetical protein LSAT2_020727, partial [Lamellibrachia satsuma]
TGVQHMTITGASVIGDHNDRETRPSDDTNQETRQSGYTNKEIRPSGDTNQGTRPSDDTNQGTTPSGDTNQGTRPSDDTNQETRPSGDTNQETRPSGDTNQETRPSDDTNHETRPSDDTNQETRTPSDTNQETRPSRDTDQETRPSRDTNQETRPSDDTNQETRSSGDTNQEIRPLGDTNQGIRSSRGTNQETRPSDGTNQETRQSGDTNQDTRPSDDTNEETRQSDDTNQETRPSDDTSHETRQSDDTNQGTRPSGDKNQETRPSGDTNQETTPSGDANQETRPSSDTNQETEPTTTPVRTDNNKEHHIMKTKPAINGFKQNIEASPHVHMSIDHAGTLNNNAQATTTVDNRGISMQHPAVETTLRQHSVSKSTSTQVLVEVFNQQDIIPSEDANMLQGKASDRKQLIQIPKETNRNGSATQENTGQTHTTGNSIENTRPTQTTVNSIENTNHIQTTEPLTTPITPTVHIIQLKSVSTIATPHSPSTKQVDTLTEMSSALLTLSRTSTKPGTIPTKPNSTSTKPGTTPTKPNSTSTKPQHSSLATVTPVAILSTEPDISSKPHNTSTHTFKTSANTPSTTTEVLNTSTNLFNPSTKTHNTSIKSTKPSTMPADAFVAKSGLTKSTSNRTSVDISVTQRSTATSSVATTEPQHNSNTQPTDLSKPHITTTKLLRTIAKSHDTFIISTTPYSTIPQTFYTKQHPIPEKQSDTITNSISKEPADRERLGVTSTQWMKPQLVSSAKWQHVPGWSTTSFNQQPASSSTMAPTSTAGDKVTEADKVTEGHKVTTINMRHISQQPKDVWQVNKGITMVKNKNLEMTRSSIKPIITNKVTAASEADQRSNKGEDSRVLQRHQDALRRNSIPKVSFTRDFSTAMPQLTSVYHGNNHQINLPKIPGMTGVHHGQLRINKNLKIVNNLKIVEAKSAKQDLSEQRLHSSVPSHKTDKENVIYSDMEFVSKQTRRFATIQHHLSNQGTAKPTAPQLITTAPFALHQTTEGVHRNGMDRQMYEFWVYYRGKKQNMPTTVTHRLYLTDIPERALQAQPRATQQPVMLTQTKQQMNHQKAISPERPTHPTDKSTTYSISKTTPKDESTAYHITTTTPKHGSTTYHITTTTSKDGSTAYNIITTTSKDRSTTDHITTTPKDGSTTDHITTTTPKDGPTTYHITTTTPKDGSTIYHVTTTTSKDGSAT